MYFKRAILKIALICNIFTNWSFTTDSFCIQTMLTPTVHLFFSYYVLLTPNLSFRLQSLLMYFIYAIVSYRAKIKAITGIGDLEFVAQNMSLHIYIIHSKFEILQLYWNNSHRNFIKRNYKLKHRWYTYILITCFVWNLWTSNWKVWGSYIRMFAFWSAGVLFVWTFIYSL